MPVAKQVMRRVVQARFGAPGVERACVLRFQNAGLSIEPDAMRPLLRSVFRSTLSIGLMLAVLSTAQATPPRQHWLQQEGGEPTPVTGVDLVHTSAIGELFRRYGSCSSFGSPKGRWLVREQQLFLIGLVVCGPDVALEKAYPQAQEGEMLATWVSGKVKAGRGRVLCWRGLTAYQPPIYEQDVEYTVEAGRVLDMHSTDNRQHPELPDPDAVKARRAVGKWPAHVAPLCKGFE